MTVTIKLQKPDGTLIGTFPAQDRQSILQIAQNNGIEIPISCGMGLCEVCKCKIVTWNQYVQIDKISPPILPLERSKDGAFQEVFTCIGGLTSQSIKDKENHEVVLEKNM